MAIENDNKTAELTRKLSMRDLPGPDRERLQKVGRKELM